MAELTLELRGSSWHRLRAGVLGGKGWAEEYGRRRGRADVAWAFWGAALCRILVWAGYCQAFLKRGLWGKKINHNNSQY